MERFSKDFLFGVATAAYQIEGGAYEDGKGESVWDRFCKTPGKVARGESGDVAVDHYHRWPEDLDLMKELGMQGYRFSVAWTRMFPEGDSRREERGFEFYDRLIDGMLERGIKPFPTLFHWDLPQALQDKGGWENRETAYRFGEFAGAFAERFGDRVTAVATINEPWVFSWLGHALGYHAPGLESPEAAVRASHHTVLAHNLAYDAIKSVKPNLPVGMALSQSLADVDDIFDPQQMKAAALFDVNQNTFWMDGLIKGAYPQLAIDTYGKTLSDVLQPGDLQPNKLDWLGINYYFNTRIGPEVSMDNPSRVRVIDKYLGFGNDSNPVGELTDMSWPITPPGLSGLLTRWHREYGEALPPIYITENGVAYDDESGADGRVRDQRRSDYLNLHLLEVSKAIEAGVDVRGYFLWSFLDNFEWAVGYAKRFGIVHVNYQTQVRTPKDSAHFYSEVARTRGANLVSRQAAVA